MKGLHVEITRSCHDLVFSPSDITPNLHLYNQIPEKLAMEKYEEYCNEFYAQGVTMTRQYMIKRIADEIQKFYSWSFAETYNLIIGVSNTLLLNELEVVYWSLLLRFKIDGMKPLLFAYFTAFLAKVSLNTEIQPFEVYLNSFIPNFKIHFNNWQLVSDFPCEISMSDINKRFKQLTDFSVRSMKDYEGMVEQLMQIPRRKESIMSESYLSERDFDTFDKPSLEEFEMDLLLEAQHCPIDKLEG